MSLTLWSDATLGTKHSSEYSAMSAGTAPEAMIPQNNRTGVQNSIPVLSWTYRVKAMEHGRMGDKPSKAFVPNSRFSVLDFYSSSGTRWMVLGFSFK
jgi:hypothetical protein